MKKYMLLTVMLIACGLLLAAGGCKTKLPAGDVDIARNFAPEIATLKDPNLSTSSLDKYNAACIIAENVDFSYLRDTTSMENIFGQKDATIGTFEGNDYILYTYKFKDKSVQFRFSIDGTTIISASVKRGGIGEVPEKKLESRILKPE
ncbi:MAG: hypothetical protein WCV67_04610 [Victivallaceae bacterium]|jgi:hypothetical protein